MRALGEHLGNTSLFRRLHHRPPGYRLSVGRIVAIYCGLAVIILMASLDQTILATALPQLVSDLGGLSNYAWVFTSYLLCQTITVPIYGKLGDIHGRRKMLLTALTIFMVGSACCGAAQNMTELVVFRGLQGIGAGGLISLAMATVGTIVPPRDRGRYQGFLSGAFATSAVLGPAVGGLIVDHTTWRWIFYVNLPIGAVALLIIGVAMPKRMTVREHSIDYLGAALLAGGSGAFLLGLMLGGNPYAWSSIEVVGAFAASIVLLSAFVFVERRVREPIVSFALLRQPIVATCAAAVGLAATGILATVAFVPLFVQGVIGTSATSSGIVLTPYMLAAVSASILGGQWITRTGRYRVCALVGCLVYATGLFLLSRMDVGTTTGEAARNMAITGAGQGMMMNVYMIAAQNAVRARIVGMTTAFLQFTQAIGLTLGVTLFGVIVNHGVSSDIREDAALAHRLPSRDRVQLAEALQPAFLLASCLSLVLFVVVFVGLKEHALRRTLDDPPGMDAAAVTVPYAAPAVDTRP